MGSPACSAKTDASRIAEAKNEGSPFVVMAIVFATEPTLRRVVTRHLPNRFSNARDIVIRHRLVDRHLNTRLQDGFRLGRLMFRVVHLRESKFSHRPLSGKESMFEEHRIAMQWHRDISCTSFRPVPVG